MEADVLLPTDATREWVRALWLAAGCAPAEAQRVAEHLVAANLARVEGHPSGGDACSNKEVSACDSLRRGARNNGHKT